MSGAHIHEKDTNGDRYRCPVYGCWWTATGAQRTWWEILKLPPPERLT